MNGQRGRTILRHRFVRTSKSMNNKLRLAVRYLQDRPLARDETPPDRALFTARTMGLSQSEARALILEHAGRHVAYHRLILSPGVPVEDVQRWTRLVMAELSRHLGQDVHWVAAVHRNTTHPHVHLLLAGTGEWQPGGQTAPVRLGTDAYAVLRAAGDRHGRDIERAEHRLEDSVRNELDLAMVGLMRALADELTKEGVQRHRHLNDYEERRGAPGRDATRGH